MRRLTRILLTLALLGCVAPSVTRSPAISLDEARERFDDGDLEQAARLASDVLDAEPERVDARLLLAGARYRQGRFEEAADEYGIVVGLQPDHADARIGLAYADLQRGRLGDAYDGFHTVLERSPSDPQCLRGLVLIAQRPGADPTWIRAGRDAGQQLQRADPDDNEIKLALLVIDDLLGSGEGELRLGGGQTEPSSTAPRFDVRSGRDYLEIREDGRWVPIFLKGFNLGAARPGKHPTEFPEDEQTWRTWLDIIGNLGANTVRTYTLLPPAFYRALAAHNDTAAPRERLWLLQGVWTELPPRHDFLDPAYLASFEAEIARVIDAVHGDLVLAPKPASAHGIYDVDVSSSVAGWLIGREWEPFAVVDFNEMYPGMTSWSGTWFTAEGAAMECWVARTLDFATEYEAGRHGVVRPMSFANWPTLDPLDHPTEASRSEEDRIRARRDRTPPNKLALVSWEDDRVSLDATKVRATDRMPAGSFASYHVYPNYPDFLNLDPTYATGRDADGPSRYAAYLDELKAYHGDQPVVVAEFGISTSRGIAHVQPQGWHHGGLDEREQGRLVARMLRNIHDADYAGGIVFEFMDEWFKGTWSTTPWELPGDRRRTWFSAESPEQSYGVMAYRPARAGIRVDGDPTDWTDVPVLAKGSRGSGWSALRELRATSDEGWVYVLLRTDGGPDPPDWTELVYRLAFDTFDPNRGGTALPEPGRERLDRGVEFIVDLAGPDASRVRAVAGYDPAAVPDKGLLRPPPAGEHPFVPMRFMTNRERFARDGTRFRPVYVERGKLRYGSLEPASPLFDTRADVAIGADTGTIELRLPWGLLNVADPSTHRVLVRENPEASQFSTETTDGFHLKVFVSDPRSPDDPPSATLPRRDAFAPLTWEAWEDPTWTFEPKHGSARIRATMHAIPGRVERRDHDDDR